MKSLILLRHGPAGHRDEPPAQDDDRRPLTRKGRKVSRDVARAMRRLGARPQAIATSPLVRAEETARIVADAMGLADDLATCDALLPGTAVPEVIDALVPLLDAVDSLLVVGHEPDLSRLAAMLVSGRPQAVLELRKGGFCLLATDGLRRGKCAVLRALLNPQGLVGDGE